MSGECRYAAQRRPAGAGGRTFRRARTARAARVAGGAIVAAWLVACGNDGTIGLAIPPVPEGSVAVVRGTVFAPNGVIASRGGLGDWFRPPVPWSTAYAVSNPNVRPVGGGAVVSLLRVPEIDAADGVIETAILVGQALTSLEGMYQIATADPVRAGECGLMTAVGGGELLMRAFAFAPVTDIDVCSETTVRVVLRRLTAAPPAYLCDFSVQELRVLQTIVCDATFLAAGNSIAEINRAALDAALQDPCVVDAVEKATGTDTDGTPPVCRHYYLS